MTTKSQVCARQLSLTEESIGAERWEIRTRPLGCQVSTITSLTSLVSIVSTIIFIGIVAGLVFAIRRIRRNQQQRESNQWHFWGQSLWRSRGASWFLPSSNREDSQAEEEPLLRARRSSSRSYGSGPGEGGRTQAHRAETSTSGSRRAAWSPEISPKTSFTNQPELTGGMRATSSYSRRTSSSSSS